MIDYETLFEFENILCSGDITRLKALKGKEVINSEQSRNVTGRINLEILTYKYDKELEVTLRISNGYNHFLTLNASFDENRYLTKELLTKPVLKYEEEIINRAVKDGRVTPLTPPNEHEQLCVGAYENNKEFNNFDESRIYFINQMEKIKEEEKSRVYFERVSGLIKISN